MGDIDGCEALQAFFFFFVSELSQPAGWQKGIVFENTFSPNLFLRPSGMGF